MDYQAAVQLTASALAHFPLCDQYEFVARELERHMGNAGYDAASARNLLMEAAGANAAASVDPATLRADQAAAIKYLAVFKALLAPQAGAEDEEEASEEAEKEDEGTTEAS